MNNIAATFLFIKKTIFTLHNNGRMYMVLNNPWKLDEELFKETESLDNSRMQALCSKLERL